MSILESLALLKLEGKVVLSLISGFWGLGDYPKRFTELKHVLRVSDPGLSKALRRLQIKGIIKRDDEGLYHVNPEFRTRLGALLQPFYSNFLLERARLIAEDLQQYNEIVSLIVFGSVAQGKANYDSDIDLLIVVQEWEEPLEQTIREATSKLAVRIGLPIDSIVVSTSSLNTLLQQELQFLFGILQGYIILYDRSNIARSFHAKMEEVKGKYEYFEEIPLWLPRMR